MIAINRELQAALAQVSRPRRAVRRNGMWTVWDEYESRKAEIPKGITDQQYQAEVSKITEELGI